MGGGGVEPGLGQPWSLWHTLTLTLVLTLLLTLSC